MGKVLFPGYFPFCLTPGVPSQTGRGTNYPISLPLTKYMKWWWRVRTWEATGSSVGNELAPSENLSNIWTTASLVQDTKWTLNITQEEELVCLNQPRYIQGAFNITGNQGSTTNDTSITFYPEGYISGTTVFPKITMGSYPDGGYIEGGEWYNTRSPGDSKVQAAVDPVSEMIIDGIIIPIYVRWFPNWAQYSDWQWTGSQSYVLTPKTYWSYGGTYNTQTGQPL